MPSLKALLLSAILAPLSLSLAATPTETEDECPQGWYPNTSRGDTKCCFGHMMIDERGASCCVHYGHEPQVTDWSMAGVCFEKIPFTASDYSDMVSSASTEAATATATVPGTAAATTTGPSTTETASTTDSDSDSSSGSGSGSESETASPTTNAARAVATAEGMVLGGAAVVALLAL